MTVTLPDRLVQEAPCLTDTPIDPAAELTRLGGGRWLAEAEAMLGNQRVWAVARSGRRVDVGSWFGFPRLWCFLTDEALYGAAWGTWFPGLRPVEQRYPYDQLETVVYNDVTGSLLLRSIGTTEIPALPFAPVTGYHLAARIERLRQQ